MMASQGHLKAQTESANKFLPFSVVNTLLASAKPANRHLFVYVCLGTSSSGDFNMSDSNPGLRHPFLTL